MKLPILHLEVNKPTRESLAWYTAISAMTAAGLLEWPLAAVVVTGHLISENTRSEAVSQAAGGVESAAG